MCTTEPSLTHRVCILTSSFPQFVGDTHAGSFILGLAQGLSAKGLETVVLAPHAPGLERNEKMGAVNVRRFRYFPAERWQQLCYGSGVLWNLRKRPLARLQVPLFLISQMVALRSLVHKQRIHVVNSHWMIMQGLVGAAMRRGWQVPHVMTIHAAELFALVRMPGGRALARFIVRNSDAIFVVSSYNRKVLSELVGREVKVTVLPMGIDVASFPPSFPRMDETTRPCLLCLGRFVEKKGMEYLIRAMAIVGHKLPTCQLVLAGGGPLEGSFRSLVMRLSLQETVQFLGPIPHAEVPRLMAQATLVVVPSIVDSHGETEGMPVVLLEAMASGKPVIGTTVAGIPDIIQDGHNGFLIHPKDPDDLADKILRALSDPGRLETLGRNARRTAERYDWSIVAAQYKETFDAVLATRKS
jgi:glycosyltransferase involved in cell wall biosynthesis